jgi:hypothetical protein
MSLLGSTTEIHHWSWQAVGAALLITLTACTPYPRPVVESIESSAPAPLVGIIQFMDERPDLKYRLIAVHGVGEQPPNFADAWMSEFAKAARLSSAGTQKAAAYDMGETSNHQPVPEGMWPNLEEYNFTHTHGDQSTDLRAYAVNWSPLTKPYKDNLVDDETPPKFTRKRAILNSDLKLQLLDDRLLDAVMYAGAYKATLKQALDDALCRAMRDDGSGPVAGGAACSWSSISNQVASTRRLIFFTHSLGGRMVFDVLTDLLKDKQGPAYAALRNGFQIYMFANQLSLLELTDHADPFDRSQGNAIARFSQAVKGAATEHGERVRGQFVAFNDPNDILSYQVPRHMMLELGTGGSAANVTISNAVTWFGLIEDPTAAHDNYLIKGRVWNAVAAGVY